MSGLPSSQPSATPTLYDPGSVNVARAEEAFYELQREFSRRSQQSRSESSPTKAHRDPEKAEIDTDEQFDLREYLSSSNDESRRAGIHHKHVGVTWDNLQVEIAGGINHKVLISDMKEAGSD